MKHKPKICYRKCNESSKFYLGVEFKGEHYPFPYDEGVTSPDLWDVAKDFWENQATGYYTSFTPWNPSHASD